MQTTRDTTSPILAQSVFGPSAVPRPETTSATTAPAQQYEYRPFLTPLPVWDYWAWLIVPLCLGVSVVYKSAKCWKMSEVPREAIKITLWILGAMVLAAFAIWTVTWFATPT